MEQTTLQTTNNKSETFEMRPTVVVIDDDPQILLLLETSLRNENYHLISCENGKEGLEAAQKHNPAVIVCDWMMPEMDGLEVCREVKSNPDLKLTYFILLTAWGNTDDRVVAFDTGADDFIQKPPNIKELRARVRAGLRIHDLSWALHLKQKEMEFDLFRAREYLQSILPHPLHTRHPSGTKIDLDSIFITSTHLGGDVFNYQWIDDNSLAIYLLDVAGHGVGAALLSVSIQNLLRTRSLSADLNDPLQVMRALNLSFPMEKQNNLFFTMWYGIFDLKERTIRYACAGHPPAIYQEETGRMEKLKTKGIPIGMGGGFPYGQGEIEVKAPFILTLFSDGIYETEVRSEGGELENWINVIEEQPSRTPPYDIRKNLDFLINQARERSEYPRFEDDVSLIQLSIEY